MKPMREKLLWISVVILGVVLTASHAQSPAPRTPAPAFGDVGRYQLFSGPIPSEAGEGNALYRIDTRTGKTWIHVLQPKGDGSFTSAWAATPE
jgi:hypothetical protein